MTAVKWRDAMTPKDRSGQRAEDGLQAHLRLLHGYALTRTSVLTVIQRVFLHERAGQHQHTEPR